MNLVYFINFVRSLLLVGRSNVLLLFLEPDLDSPSNISFLSSKIFQS